MSDPDQHASTQAGRPLFWGRYSALVFLIALAGVILDQVTKLWLVYGFKLAVNGPVELLPVLDLVLVWNRGISYGLFEQNSDLGRWLLVVLTGAVTIGLWIWSARCQSRLVALALALVIGGAIGNGIDRMAFGAVVDFVHFHVGTFSWYVFNLADVWIVAGVAGLLYDSFRNGPNSAAK
ncbi:signal peptidase II [Roseibium salinum]|uniref:Lipoprotein signal peptidase n=1 Tax=Roseibium salinum TaxID=1604349 RepID=A0ABT3R471_9HYPH|nr:signal peptidase II [Roseibium sp. DSM 29163]MCX2723863.1 signal peptidase II [Roseibium sp. DSM 29163]MDN3718320.1 signal peptidase II [Roseibium salinum]